MPTFFVFSSPKMDVGSDLARAEFGANSNVATKRKRDHFVFI